jgi:prepilin-type processing-associated H-X9-DG protein
MAPEAAFAELEPPPRQDELAIRWLLLGAGLLLCAAGLCLGDNPLYRIYGETFHIFAKLARKRDVGKSLLLATFLLGSAALACAPLLVALSHSRQRRLLQWRHLGWLILLPLLTVGFSFLRGGWVYWPLYLLVLGLALLCRATVPWQRGEPRGFPLLPDRDEPPAAPENQPFMSPALRRRVRSILLAVAALAVLLWVVTPRTTGDGESLDRAKCSNNLRQMWLAALAYAGPNGDLPPTLAALLSQARSPQMFVCPASTDTPAPGADYWSQALTLYQPGHCSYIYIGNTLRGTPPADAVIAFEAPDHDACANVLWGDGHIDLVRMPGVVAMLRELEAGHNPPNMETTLSFEEATAIYQRDWKPRLPQMKRACSPADWKGDPH